MISDDAYVVIYFNILDIENIDFIYNIIEVNFKNSS